MSRTALEERTSKTRCSARGFFWTEIDEKSEEEPLVRSHFEGLNVETTVYRTGTDLVLLDIQVGVTPVGSPRGCESFTIRCRIEYSKWSQAAQRLAGTRK